MDRISDIDQLAREYMASPNGSVGQATGVVASQVWGCLVCSSQGRRVGYWNETPSHTPDSLGMGACARDSHQMALLDWGITDKAETCLGIFLWEGSKLSCEVLIKGSGFNGMEEVMYFLTGLADLTEASRQTLAHMVPQLNIQRDEDNGDRRVPH